MLRARGLRVEVDDSSNRMQNKIRLAQEQKVPYMLVLGDREVEARTASPRTRSGEQLGRGLGGPGRATRRADRRTTSALTLASRTAHRTSRRTVWLHARASRSLLVTVLGDLTLGTRRARPGRLAVAIFRRDRAARRHR